ncbi:NAD(P)H-dependent oxidoreductase [bacterium]|nr:NAD(P)H-dependent oxidoreductase [bacterium]
MNILYIDASVRSDSRTQRLSQYFLDGFSSDNVSIKEIKLTHECIPPLTMESLEHRTELSEQGNFDEPIFHYARDYVDADMILICAPYWDLSFPATLKTYIEAINVVGLVFMYDENGKPIGLCNAKRLVYITTAGGEIISDDFGYGYIKELAEKFHGIKNVDYIKAEKLDIVGADVEKILSKAEDKIDKLITEINKECEKAE